VVVSSDNDNPTSVTQSARIIALRVYFLTYFNVIYSTFLQKHQPAAPEMYDTPHMLVIFGSFSQNFRIQIRKY
jgi:hypothetical protein